MWQHFKGMVENVNVSCSKFSQLSNTEKNETLSKIDKVTICNAVCLTFWTTLYIRG